MTVPVLLGNTQTRFVLDTGIGPTLLSSSLCERTGCALTGSVFSGRRMSGQEVTAQLACITALRLCDLERHDFEVCVFDFSGFPAELEEIGGFLSLSFFDEQPFTVDYPRSCVTFEDAGSLDARLREGIVVEIALERDGPSLDAFLPLTIRGDASISVEADMGSEALILDERFAEATGVDLAAPDVRRVESDDAWGDAFVRYFTTLPGSIEPTGAPELAQERPAVMFQRIIHDGLIGDSFLRRQPVTYDLAARRMIFGRQT